MRTLRITLTMVVVLASTSACNRFSRVAVQTGEPVRMQITSSDATAIHGIDKEGRAVSVERSAIVEVTYPGNVANTVYGAVGGTGLGFAALGGLLLTLPQEYQDEGAGIGGGILLVTGGTMMVVAIGPLAWYAFERRAARALVEGGESADVQVLPSVASDGERLHGGLELRVRW